jgi:hypothetical protein
LTLAHQRMGGVPVKSDEPGGQGHLGPNLFAPGYCSV